MNFFKKIEGLFRQKEFRHRWQAIAAGVFLLLCGYGFFLHQLRTIGYQVFAIDQSPSWEQSAEGISRIDAKGNLDLLTLSQDTWRDFEAAFEVIHPRDCGFAFQYQDYGNFYLILFNGKKRSLDLYLKKDNAFSLFNRIPFAFKDRHQCLIKISNREFYFSVDGQAIF